MCRCRVKLNCVQVVLYRRIGRSKYLLRFRGVTRKTVRVSSLYANSADNNNMWAWDICKWMIIIYVY